MPKASPIQEAFNAGELAPELIGRVDVAKVAAGCSRMENFIPLVQGPARRRGGTRFVAEVKTSANRTWLARFEFNTTQTYVLEFGNLYIRFFTNNGVLESSPGVPLEVVTPYATADLTDADGSFALNMVQSGDVLYICHPSYAPRKLVRTGALTWTLSTVSTDGGPFNDVDPDQTVTLYASAATGAGVTVTASASAFASTDVGRLVYLEQKKANAILPWENGAAITAADERRSDGKVYEALNSATTGATRPTHSEGAEYDGATGVQWEYRHAGAGWAIITAYTSATVVTVTVLSRIPSMAVGSGNATTRWALGAWGSVPGWPSHVTFYKNRLVFARSVDRKLWFSVAADYENFRSKDQAGQVTADMSISISVESDQSNRIQYVIPADALIIGTAGGEHICREQRDEAFGPTNVQILATSDFGSRGVPPVRVGETVLFIQRSGRKLRAISYDVAQDGYRSLDMSILAPHTIPKGNFVRQLAYQKEPHSIIWVVRDDGYLWGFTFNKEQYAEPPFGGWHRHVIGGEGIVESAVTVPSPSNDRDDLWLIVRRTIDGNTERYVERMEAEYESGDDQKDAFYVDSGLTYDGAPATTISGLGHLEGETVDILADGATHPARVVDSGSITLQQAASVVQVGLACPAKLATMRTNAGAADGTAQGKTKRIHRVVVRLLDTLGGEMGPTDTITDEILFRKTGDPMNQPVPLFTGDKELAWPGGYEKEGIIWYVNSQPLPATVCAFMPQLVTQDR
jgi:hypothetical protein